jgi:hypothetical protein
MAKKFKLEDGTEVSQVEYLYGTGVIPPEIPKASIHKRIELLDENLKRVLDVDYLNRDGTRANAIMKAKRFWQNINTVDGD